MSPLELPLSIVTVARSDGSGSVDDSVLIVTMLMKELSKITMPVVFNEPLSFLQRMVEYMEYARLLKQASSCDDPLRRFEVTNFVSTL